MSYYMLVGNEFCMKSNHSLKISNGLWNDFSEGYGGKNALDYFIKAKGYSFLDAVKLLIEKTKIVPINLDNFNSNSIQKIEIKNLVLPQKSPTNFNIKSYLKSRCIDEEIINYCIENNFIYEDLSYHNIVFVRL